MTANKKTIGPMARGDLYGELYWELNGNAILCDRQTRRLAHVPAMAKKLWVELAKRKPSHSDAFKVSNVTMWFTVRLDSRQPIEFRCDATHILQEFIGTGSHCYATIYYE